MRNCAAVVCLAFILAFFDAMPPAAIPGERRLAAFAAENDDAVAEEGANSRAHKEKRRTHCRPRHYQAAPYPQTPIGEERLRQLKQLHREERGKAIR